LRTNTRKSTWSERDEVTGGLSKIRNKKFLFDSFHETNGIFRRMEDPRCAPTILIGGFEEQTCKSNIMHIYEHYTRTNLVGDLFSE
jgi:hypothetical protein